MLMAAVGQKGIKNIYRALEDHETSKIYENVAKSYLVASKSAYIRYIDTLLSKDAKQIANQKLKVVERLINIVVFIGRHGLAYCVTETTAVDLDRTKIIYGNFLELVLLLSKYDQIL